MAEVLVPSPAKTGRAVEGTAGEECWCLSTTAAPLEVIVQAGRTCTADVRTYSTLLFSAYLNSFSFWCVVAVRMIVVS